MAWWVEQRRDEQATNEFGARRRCLEDEPGKRIAGDGSVEMSVRRQIKS